MIQPYYDRISQEYKNIITINIEPEGPLKRYVRRIQLPRLSYFQQLTDCRQCILALTNPNYACQELVTPFEIPDLFTFLSSNGYEIDTKITKMMNTNGVTIGNQKILCLIRYIHT